MNKWADFLISAVKFNDKHTHIDKVRAYPDNGDNLGSLIEQSRANVVAAIKKGTTFITIFKNEEGKWKKGQPVFTINIHGTEYIKTVDNGKAIDNLDNLPEF
jgi:hypothetical protein